MYLLCVGTPGRILRGELIEISTPGHLIRLLKCWLLQGSINAIEIENWQKFQIEIGDMWDQVNIKGILAFLNHQGPSQ